MIHIPDCQPNMNMDETEYRNHEGTTINHFYEKLLLIKDMMNTRSEEHTSELQSLA